MVPFMSTIKRSYRALSSVKESLAFTTIFDKESYIEGVYSIVLKFKESPKYTALSYCVIL